jgi:signal transduction histidine kinase
MVIPSFVNGQSPFNPDSLRKVLASTADNESKLMIMKELANGFLATESYDSSILFCDSAIMLSVSLGDTDRQAELNITRGNALFYSMGPEKGMEPYKESYQLYAHIGDSAGMAKALNGMGVMYKKMGHYDSAMSCYLQLATIAEKRGYEQTLGMGYVNIGILYQDMLDFEKANHYLDLSIPINEKYRADLVALAFMNKGLVHNEQMEYDSALFRYRQALAIYSEMDNQKKLADLYNNIGNLYYRSDLDSAYHYYLKAKDAYVAIGDWYTFCQAYNNLALVVMDRGNNDQALKMLDSSIAVAKRHKNTELLSIAYKNKHKVFYNKGSYRLALESYMLHDSVDSVLYNLEKDKLMGNLEAKYQNEKKQAQILTLERDNLKKDLALQIRTRQSNIYLFTGIGIIALISFAFLYFRQRTLKDRIISQQRIRQLEEEKKLLAARALVEGQEEERKRIATELHDGLGVLLSTTKMQFSAILEKSPENQLIIDRASQLLEQASSDVRKISHNMMPGLLTKFGLYEAVEDLLDRISETEEINVHHDIPEDAERMAENKEIMVYRIIQEMVNNTLKHAHANNIDIRMQVLSGHLDILYKDDGKGFDVDKMMESKSLGLKSMQSRINFLAGMMEMRSEPGEGVTYQLQIPF